MQSAKNFLDKPVIKTVHDNGTISVTVLVCVIISLVSYA